MSKILTFGGYALTVGNNAVGASVIEPPPEPLPANTVRVRTNDGYEPVKADASISYETATLVPGTSDVYDVYKSGTSFKNLLRGAYNVIEVLGANTSNVTNMYGMFYGCSALTTVQLFDTSNVTDMSWMFQNCSALTTVPLFDTSNVTNMQRMFYGCSALNSVPLFDTSNVTNMANMFQNCSALTTVPLFNTSKVTNMSEMLGYCSALTTVPLFNTSKVTNMSWMMEHCSALTAVPLLDTSKVTNMNYMFSSCYKVATGALALYQRASSQATPPSNHTRTFRDCGRDTVTGAAELAQIPSDWK